jgi:hypothetical protein
VQLVQRMMHAALQQLAQDHEKKSEPDVGVEAKDEMASVAKRRRQKRHKQRHSRSRYGHQVCHS